VYRHARVPRVRTLSPASNHACSQGDCSSWRRDAAARSTSSRVRDSADMHARLAASRDSLAPPVSFQSTRQGKEESLHSTGLLRLFCGAILLIASHGCKTCCSRRALRPTLHPVAACLAAHSSDYPLVHLHLPPDWKTLSVTTKASLHPRLICTPPSGAMAI
jgi:hypothetical protein